MELKWWGWTQDSYVRVSRMWLIFIATTEKKMENSYVVVSNLWKRGTHFYVGNLKGKIVKFFKKQKYSWKYELQKIF